MSSSSNPPCAACKFLRRKCTPGCIFAPYFPADNSLRFSNVHRVFGASNVSKILNELTPALREDAVNSLAYEADARLRDPVFGCVGYISLLQHRLRQLQLDLSVARRELSIYIRSGSQNQVFADHQYQQLQMMVEAEQLAAAREREMMRSMEQQQVMARLMGGGSSVGAGEAAAAGDVSLPPAMVSRNVGGFQQGSFTELQHQQAGLQLQEGSGFRLPDNFQQRRRFDEGRSGEGSSS